MKLPRFTYEAQILQRRSQSDGYSKKPQDQRPCGLNFANTVRLIFDDHALDRAMFSWARVINAHLLPSSQRGCHDFAGAVNYSRGCAYREAIMCFCALDQHRTAVPVRGY